MFYKVNHARLTLPELLHTNSVPAWPLVFIVWLLGRFRVPFLSPPATVDRLEPFLIDKDDLPEETQLKIAPLEAEFQACGFVDPVYYWIVNPYTTVRMCIVAYRHPSGTAVGEIVLRRIGALQQRELLVATIATIYRDGSTFESTNARREWRAPPNMTIQRKSGASVAELWRFHGEQSLLHSLGKTILPVTNREDVVVMLDQHMAQNCEFQKKRGVFVPCDPETHQVSEAVVAAPVVEEDQAFAAVYGEIGRLANRRVSWVSTVLILLVTIALFFAFWRDARGWEPLVLISGVLLFHELGHLLTMWLFRYRNLRMFFIPFLGAAVTGQNYNVPGWKKAIVSLMGPLPGILLGAAIGVVGVMYDWPLAWKASLLLLGINAFNLLPIMPLDGGQVMHAVLFSRHPVLDTAFRGMAAALLLATALFGGKLLAVIGIGILVALPTTYRVGRVVQRLRQRGFNASSPDAQTIPMETAHAIHQELQQSLPTSTNVRTSAQLTLQAFETLNARPPGWLASCALLGMHATGILLAIAMLIGLVVARHGGLWGLLMSPLLPQPKHVVQADELCHKEGAHAAPAACPKVITLVATCADKQQAQAAYQAAAAKLPDNAAAALFGQTLLITLPADDEAGRVRWLRELEQHAQDVFVQRPDNPAQFVLTCKAPNSNAADALENDAQTYFGSGPLMGLVPPWSAEHGLDEHDRRARRTQQAVQERRWSIDLPADVKLNRELDDAIRRGDVAARKKLAKKQEEQEQGRLRKVVQEMGDEGVERWDAAVLDFYEHTPDPNMRWIASEDERKQSPEEILALAKVRQKEAERWWRHLGAHLGQLPLAGDSPAPGADRFSTAWGSVMRSGDKLYFTTALVRPGTGSAALLDWLARYGCTDFKYEFCYGGAEFDDEEF